MLRTTVMVLAPGCRWMFGTTAAVSFIHAAWREFSTPSVIAATFFRKTGAPLR